MKKIICFLSLSMVLASCSSDDSTETVENNNPALFVTKTVEDMNTATPYTTLYTYNGNKIVSALDEVGDGYFYTYTGDLITKVENKEDGEVTETEFYTYDAQQRLSTYLVLNEEFESGYKFVYAYNLDGTVTISQYRGTMTSQPNLHATSTAFFENGEVVKITSSVEMTLLYTYDDKNNPFKNVLGYSKISYDDTSALGMSHNVTTSNDFFGPNEDVDTTTYTYNIFNYPVTETFRGSTINYFYE